jgi:hypothetical protein
MTRIRPRLVQNSAALDIDDVVGAPESHGEPYTSFNAGLSSDCLFNIPRTFLVRGVCFLSLR